MCYDSYLQELSLVLKCLKWHCKFHSAEEKTTGKRILKYKNIFRDLYASEEHQLSKSDRLHEKYVSKLKQEADNYARLRRSELFIIHFVRVNVVISSFLLQYILYNVHTVSTLYCSINCTVNCTQVVDSLICFIPEASLC